MMESPEIPKILKLDEEEKKRYGNSGFGDACLLARNILAAERGTRFVAVKRGSRPAVIFFCDASEPPSSMIPSTPEVIPMAAPAPAKERLKERLSLEERIQRRAYELYVQRGNESGSELDDWLQAEEEIRRAEEEALDKR